MKYWLALAVLYVVTRLAALLSPPIGTDVPIYAGYAVEYEAARQMGLSFYAFRALPEAEKKLHTAAVSTHIGPRGGTVFEYPPLALVPMLAPRLAWKALRGPSGDCTLREYAFAYRLEMALVDGLLLLGLAWLAKRLYGQESPRARAGRLALYVLGGALLPHLIYDRLDLLFAALLTTALGWLVLGRRLPALFALAVSAAFKVVSLPLAPLWAVGSLRASTADRPVGHFTRLLGLAGYGIALAALVTVLCVPAYLGGGGKCLDFLTYHTERGIQLESSYASLLFAARLVGEPLEIVNNYGSANVDSRLAAPLCRLAAPLSLLCAVLMAAIYFLRLQRIPPVRPGTAWAAAAPGLAIQMVTGGLAVLLFTSKVLSPQYLLWLLPLVCLLPGPVRRWRWTAALLLVLYGLSLLVFPILYGPIAGGFSPGAQAGLLAWLGVAVSAVRNLGLLVLAALVLGGPYADVEKST